MEFGKYIAHRGLFDESAPENSLMAFEKAASVGLAIELDVRLTRDCKLVVFHDKDLLRMCGVEADVFGFTYNQLRSFTLGNSDEKIPLLTEVLKLIDGRVPILIEIKDGCPQVEISKRLNYLLKNYNGEYGITSFNPLVLLWFRIFAPKTFRGQLISTYKGKQADKYILRKICANNKVWKYVSKPDFIACDLRSMSFEVAFQAFDVDADLYTWTANTPELLEAANEISKTVIAENFPAGFDFSDNFEDDCECEHED